MQNSDGTNPGASSAGVSRVSMYLDAAIRGDARAREELFTRCRSYVHLLARAWSLVRFQARFDASDLVQQTMMDAYRDFEQFKAAVNWNGWHGCVRFLTTMLMTQSVATEKLASELSSGSVHSTRDRFPQWVHQLRI